MDLDATLTGLALEHGVELTDPVPDAAEADIALRAPGWPAATAYKVKPYPTRLTPSRLQTISGATSPADPVRLLLAVPVASTEFLQAAVMCGVSVVITSRHPGHRGHLISADDQILHLVTSDQAGQPSRVPRGRVPWGMYAVALEIGRESSRQEDIAAKLGIHQATVSRAKRALERWPWGRGESAASKARESVLRWLASAYPRASRATATTWLSLADPVDTAYGASRLLNARGIRHAVSGQVAADLYAPWARPQRALIWAERFTDMTEADATPVPAQDANLVVAISPDPHLFVDAQVRDGLPLLAPERVFVDLVQDGDEQAAEKLLSWILVNGTG